MALDDYGDENDSFDDEEASAAAASSLSPVDETDRFLPPGINLDGEYHESVDDYADDSSGLLNFFTDEDGNPVYEEDQLLEVSSWRRKYGAVIGVLLTLVLVLCLIGLAAYFGYRSENDDSSSNSN
eukprot:CAMPEP_0177660632 /NCGR_PEP_ID=MMETSP0447-20121125/18156_1 /TAXON_ID=0 /ORGANISM="Stygamoeba regulata, Strain BSH-02190019" /LENGTH=125 /DNA_ID=CAMNT_0019165735 /DNA_START=40 /DNA_END=417 /DNA_ORIENTATION=+